VSFRLAPAKPSSAATEAMAATSQPLATISALEILRGGGNAVDAAICAAAVLCVTEPHATGIGGDLFAIVREPSGNLIGLDAAGPAPAAAPREPPALDGPRSVNVPGAVAGWAELSERFGSLALEWCLAPAIEFASRGVAIGYHSSEVWRTTQVPAFGPARGFGERFRLAELAVTLRAIGREGPAALYSGPVADAIVGSTWLSHHDLAQYRASWVTPLSQSFRGLEVSELPPPTQGVAALEALAILGDDEVELPDQVRAVALALEDALASVRDGADVSALLSAEHLAARRGAQLQPTAGPPGGTVCLCVVDGSGMAVSLLQSLYEAFGSGVIAGSTGVVLNNRAACFGVQGEVVAGTRPYHTLIPGMLTRPATRTDNARHNPPSELVGPFGVMGGFMQAQAHVQFVAELTRNGMDPQAALDRGRFRIDGEILRLEEPLWDRADELGQLGFRIERSTEPSWFGGGQAIIVRDGALFGGSDLRKDGCALGI
jgi:gamma-glutamyltranspeptidase / glutathione hydrolase